MKTHAAPSQGLRIRPVHAIAAAGLCRAAPAGAPRAAAGPKCSQARRHGKQAAQAAAGAAGLLHLLVPARHLSGGPGGVPQRRLHPVQRGRQLAAQASGKLAAVPCSVGAVPRRRRGLLHALGCRKDSRQRLPHVLLREMRERGGQSISRHQQRQASACHKTVSSTCLTRTSLFVAGMPLTRT